MNKHFMNDQGERYRVSKYTELCPCPCLEDALKAGEGSAGFPPNTLEKRHHDLPIIGRDRANVAPHAIAFDRSDALWYKTMCSIMTLPVVPLQWTLSAPEKGHSKLHRAMRPISYMT